jgi:CHAT domain
LNRAQRALDCVQSRPADAVTWSKELLADPSATPVERASAAWALGRAYAEIGQLDQAVTSLRSGITLAAEEALVELEADIRVSLATCLLLAGDTSGAQDELTRADPHLTSAAARGRLTMQRGFIEMHRGALPDAVRHFDAAEDLLNLGVDELARTRLLLNRGIALVMLGLVGRGEADFLAARSLADSLDQQMLAAGATQNLGFAAGRRGDTPAAIRWFGEARTRYADLGSPSRLAITLEIDSCNVFLAGGLFVEAAASARRAVTSAAHTGNKLDEAEARLLLARAQVANGALAEGEQEAQRAGALFRQSEREPWVAQSDYVALLASRRLAPPSTALLERAQVSADRLAASGWRREALEVRTFAGRTALALGQVELARALLGPLAGDVDEGSAALRAAAWLATALLNLADGNRGQAKAALSAGMGVVEEHRLTLGSSELRAYVSVNAAELAELGLALAAEDGNPVEVLTWAERWHAGALQAPPVQPAVDSPLARALTELREVHVSVLTGTADPFDEVDPDQRIAELERRIRDLGRGVGGGPAGGQPVHGPDLAGLLRLLGPRTLVEYVAVGHELHAVVAHDGDVTLHSLGSMAPIADDVSRIVATLGRLAYGHGSPASRRATCASLAAVAAGLDERLVAKLALPPRVELVVVPTGPLQGLPWAVLPSLHDRPVTVTPSGCLWARRGGGTAAGLTDGYAGVGRARSAGPLLVCGAGLPGGEGEIELLRALYPDAAVLVGRDATVAAVTEAMARSEVVHLAAHGEFRADNPMFSALTLHDGPLTVYDLEALRRAPTIVILPACDAARSSVRHGDELLGTAAALLQVGVRTVVAPVTVVPTAGVVSTMMAALHTHLRAGEAPAQAVCLARRELAGSHELDEVAVAASFVVIGTC